MSDAKPLRDQYGVRVIDREGNRGMVTRNDIEPRYAYEREMVLVRLDRDIGGQDLFWYDADQLTVTSREVMRGE